MTRFSSESIVQDSQQELYSEEQKEIQSLDCGNIPGVQDNTLNQNSWTDSDKDEENQHHLKESWTKVEIAKFLYAHWKYKGENWELISKFVSTKTTK